VISPRLRLNGTLMMLTMRKYQAEVPMNWSRGRRIEIR